jgi:hypothetical protein
MVRHIHTVLEASDMRPEVLKVLFPCSWQARALGVSGQVPVMISIARWAPLTDSYVRSRGAIETIRNVGNE